jgi:hypothetical protein
VHHRYVKNNKPKSAYAMHIFNKRQIWKPTTHYGTAENMRKRTQNELFGNPLYTNIPTTRTIGPGRACQASTHYTH